MMPLGRDGVQVKIEDEDKGDGADLKGCRVEPLALVDAGWGRGRRRVWDGDAMLGVEK